MRTLIFILSLLLPWSTFGQTNSPQHSNAHATYRVIALSNDGHTESVSNTDKVEINPTLYVPNAFSPDGDGVNDLFGAKTRGIEYFHMTVYDRWGEIVFETKDPQDKWEGKKDGVALPTGGYVYIIHYKPYNTSRSLSHKGTLALVR